MKIFFSNPISLYIVDDQSFYIDDLKNNYADSGKYTLYSYTSLHGFAESLKRLKPSRRKIRIAVIALRPSVSAESSPEMVTQKLLLDFPDLNIIKISGEKEMPKDESYKRSGNVIFVKRNDNTLLRVDNSIKWIIGKRTLERKEIHSRKATRFFLYTLVLFILAALIIRLAFPGLFHF